MPLMLPQTASILMGFHHYSLPPVALCSSIPLYKMPYVQGALLLTTFFVFRCLARPGVGDILQAIDAETIVNCSPAYEISSLSPSPYRCIAASLVKIVQFEPKKALTIIL